LFGTKPAAGGAAWRPTDLPNLLAWYDASETGTITHSGGAVSQWDDKGPNGYDLVQPTGSAQPITGVNTLNGLNVLNLNNQWMRATVAVSGDLTVIAVAKSTNTVGNKVITALLRANSTTASDRDFQLDQDGGTVFRSIVFDGAAKIASRTINGNANIFTAIADYSANNTFALNGNTSASTAIGSRPATSIELRIGTGHTGLFWVGDIAELIFVNGALGSTDYQKAEGYLAHQWGLTASLPSGHPYKTTAP
jgi:hypothetical protein